MVGALVAVSQDVVSLQLVGYRHVIATLWSISDWKAPAMARAFYSRLADRGPNDGPDAGYAPYAVHHAITRLHRAAPENPLLWAPYIHLGP